MLRRGWEGNVKGGGGGGGDPTANTLLEAEGVMWSGVMRRVSVTTSMRRRPGGEHVWVNRVGSANAKDSGVELRCLSLVAITLES